jgi:hypothetical protein
MNTILGRYDAPAIRRLFAEEGILAAVAERGFTDVHLRVQARGHVLPHARLYGRKHARRWLLLDACVGEARVQPDYFAVRGHAVDRPLDLVVVHWVREQDPTAGFSPDRPPLLLQWHPGLGVLRRTFRVVVRMAEELGKDAVVNVPKFYHDAFLFFRSRLFLFLDAAEQGRFEALARDLHNLSLRDASLALLGRCVRDAAGKPLVWAPGYQVFPVSALVTAYFHSAHYCADVHQACEQARFSVDPGALRRVQARCRLDDRQPENAGR